MFLRKNVCIVYFIFVDLCFSGLLSAWTSGWIRWTPVKSNEYHPIRHNCFSYPLAPLVWRASYCPGDYEKYLRWLVVRHLTMIALRLESNYVLDGTWLQVTCRRSAQGHYSVTFFDARVTVHWKAPPHPWTIIIIIICCLKTFWICSS